MEKKNYEKWEEKKKQKRTKWINDNLDPDYAKQVLERNDIDEAERERIDKDFLRYEYSFTGRIQNKYNEMSAKVNEQLLRRIFLLIDENITTDTGESELLRILKKYNITMNIESIEEQGNKRQLYRIYKDNKLADYFTVQMKYGMAV